jgi:hypothetical protein
VAEEEHRSADQLHHRHDIPALILKAVTFGRVRFTPAAAGDGIDGELRLEEWLHERPVGLVVAEGGVHEEQGRAAAGTGRRRRWRQRVRENAAWIDLQWPR